MCVEGGFTACKSLLVSLPSTPLQPPPDIGFTVMVFTRERAFCLILHYFSGECGASGRLAGWLASWLCVNPSAACAVCADLPLPPPPPLPSTYTQLRCSSRSSCQVYTWVETCQRWLDSPRSRPLIELLWRGLMAAPLR